MTEKMASWFALTVFLSIFIFLIADGFTYPVPVETASTEEIAAWAESREDCHAGKLYYNEDGFARVATAGSTCGK